MNDMDRIRKLIEERRREIAEMETALAVLERLHGLQERHASAAPTAGADRPFVTLRRRVEVEPEPQLGPARAPKGKVPDAILAFMAGKTKPVTSREIIDALDLSEVVNGPKRVWQTLLRLRQEGKVQRDDKGGHTLADRNITRSRQAPREELSVDVLRGKVLAAVEAAAEPLASADVITAVLGKGPYHKALRDRLYWVMRDLAAKGRLVAQDGHYRPGAKTPEAA